MLSMPKVDGNRLELGFVILTKSGQELASICGSKSVDGFFDYVGQKWLKLGYMNVVKQL
jgi:hypothetical protein